MMFAMRYPAALFLLLSCLSLQANITVVSGLSERTVVNPGESWSGSILLLNNGSETASARLFQTDYRFSAGGEAHYDSPGTQERSNASWIRLDQTRITLAPGEQAPVGFRGTVPDDPDLTGTYWSVIMVEPENPEAAPDPESDQSVGIRTLVRYAVQVISDISDTGSREVKFLDRRLVRRGEEQVLEVDVANVGEQLLRPQVKVELFDESGGRRGRFQTDHVRLFPGTSARFRVPLTGMDPASYRALVLVDDGSDDVFGAQYRLHLKAADDD